MQLAPVALFVYNRPVHTRRTIEALQLDPLAAETDLIVFSDGPRSAKDRHKVEEVRNFLHGVTGFGSVSIRISTANLGLAKSIIRGVTEVVEKYGVVVVLEDDIVISPFFLTYMNEALACYAENDAVMHISGYMYPVRQEGLPDTFFLRFPSSWGWATWQRAWSFFEKDAHALERSFSSEQIQRFNLEGSHDFWEQVKHNRQGKADTWAIFWYAAIFREGGLCLFPRQTLVDNIGQDGTGDHCLATDIFRSVVSRKRILISANSEKENELAYSRVQEFYKTNRLGKWRRFWLVSKIRLKRYLEGAS